MAFQPVPDVAQVRIVGREDGQITNNTLYFFHSGGRPSFLDLGDLANQIAIWVGGGIQSYASAAWAAQLVLVKDLTDATGAQAAAGFSVGTGGVGGGPAPNNVSFAISFHTALSGRSYRGRNFIPGIPLQAVSGNTITSDFITNYVNAYNALTPGGGAVTPSWTWVVVSRVSGGVDRVAGQATPITFATNTDNIIDSMRRRLPGRGA